jgi:phospholipid transport system substrate-binding protein
MSAAGLRTWAAAALLSVPVGLVLCARSLAQEAPDQLVKGLTEEVLATIKRDKEIQSGNMRRLIDIVEMKVIPHFDFTRMTRTAMAVNWRRATPEQQKVLVQEFKILLVRTYSNALASYRDQAVDFKPLRARSDDTEVTVRSEIRQKGQQSVPLDYDMEKTEGGWKVFDVKVGGVSLISTYREDFSGQVRESGIDGLIKALSARNRQLETKGRT